MPVDALTFALALIFSTGANVNASTGVHQGETLGTRLVIQGIHVQFYYVIRYMITETH